MRACELRAGLGGFFSAPPPAAEDAASIPDLDCGAASRSLQPRDARLACVGSDSDWQGKAPRVLTCICQRAQASARGMDMHIRVGQERFLDLARRINAEIYLEYIPEKSTIA